MEVDAGRPGGRPVRDGSGPTRSRLRTNVVLYVVALLTACACVLVGVTAVRAAQDDTGATPEATAAAEGDLSPATAAEQERFGDVVETATEVANAFVNIRYDDVDASIARVKALATGDFADQYDKSTEALLEVLGGSKAVMIGDVVWAGVVSADADSATVIVATSGTVANTLTKNKPVARTFRLQLSLANVEGEWKANDLQFVEERT